MKEFQWSDKTCSDERKSFLLFIKGDEIISFAGGTIPGVVEMRDTSYNRMLSCTVYRLRLANDIRAIAGMNGWKTSGFVEGLGYALKRTIPYTWADVAKALGVSIPSTMRFLRSLQPKEAKNLDEIGQALAELEKVSKEETYFTIVAIVTFSFGSPSYQAIRDGYWGSHKSIPGFEAQIHLIDPNSGWVKGNIEIIGISGAVLSVQHNPGMNGGFYTVSIAVISWTGGIPIFPNLP